MTRRFAFLAALLCLTAPAVAQDMPKSLVPELIATERAMCGTYATGYGKTFVNRVDLTGDGRPELVLDWRESLCAGRPQPYCNEQGCLLRVYVGAGSSWRKVFEGRARTWGPGTAAGRPALVLDGRTLPWTGSGFGS